MYIAQLLRKLNPKTLVEVVDSSFGRIYYSTVEEATQDDVILLTGLLVEEVNPFIARTAQAEYTPAVQIRISGAWGKN